MKHMTRVGWVGLMSIAVCVAAGAQAPRRIGLGEAAATAHPNDLPPDLQALPGDRLPPFGMLDQNGRLKPQAAPPPGGRGNATPPLPHSTVAAPPLEVAMEGARAAIADCVARGRRGAVSVVDAAGEPRVMLSADGEDGSHVYVAVRKTLATLEFRVTSAQAKEMVAKDPTLVARLTPAMFVQFGAIPITSRGQIIGAIGYSGGDDVNCATAGWKVIQSRLPQ